MMLQKTLTLAFTLISLPALAAQEWVVDSAQSTLGFTAQQGDEKFSGGFKQFNSSINFSADDLAHSSISTTVMMGSAFAGTAERDDALPGSNWFNISAFPQAQFVTKSIKAVSPDHYLAEATLTIRGMSKDVQLPFTLTTEKGKTHAVGAVTIQRNDYQVGQGEFSSDGWIKFPVTITVDLWASPKK
jgi:polyisoprenoid-binding protein YceI